MLHGDLLRIEHAGGTSWRLLRSSQGHAPDDDDDDDDDIGLGLGLTLTLTLIPNP